MLMGCMRDVYIPMCLETGLVYFNNGLLQCIADAEAAIRPDRRCFYS